jgi:HD-GYP domain-containing protein (c-di-GMP phosphodiesterase class II)
MENRTAHQTAAGDNQSARLAELVASLSLATDLGMGQPLEQAINTCLLSMQAARKIGLTARELSDVYYLSLLRFVGCTSDAHEAALAVGGDEIALFSGMATVIMGEPQEMLGHMVRNYASDQHGLTRLRLLAGALLDGSSGFKRTVAEHCEVAQMLVTRMGIRREVGVYVGDVFERWDGKGVPGRLAGEAIPAPCRIVSIARDVEVFYRLGGWPLASDALRRRRGKAYDPSLAGLFLDNAEDWLTEAATGSAWDAVLASEPAPVFRINEARLDDALRAFADFVDLKSPSTAGHSTRVAEVSAAAATAVGLDERGMRDVHRAGLVHDLGKAGIPNGIWDKPSALSPVEWERARLHPYLTERVLSYSPVLEPLARIAGAHHERLDGSGYHRGSSAASLPKTARVLAAADAYEAMVQGRPYFPARDKQAAERQIREEVAQGKLDREAAEAVLSAAGHRTVRARQSWPAGLTDREVEVLRLIAVGHSKNAVAKELTISSKTAGRHIENIYAKIGVSSRATAALFAMEHQLLLP